MQQILTSLYDMCFTNVNEAGIRYRYFMYSINKCTDFNKNITKKQKKTKTKKTKKNNEKGNLFYTNR
jgi:hypothetical protein